MTGFDIVLVIAIILCARLGVRLYSKWKEMKDDNDKGSESQDVN